MNRRWFQVDDPASRWSIAAVAAVVFLFGVLWQNAALLGRRRGRAVPGAAPRGQSGRRTHGSCFERSATRPAASSGPERTDMRHHDVNLAASAAQLLESAGFGAASPQKHRTRSSTTCWRRSAMRCSCGRKPKQHLTQLHVVRAIRQLDEAMALVPAGRVLLGQLAEQSNSACGAADVDPKLISRNLVNVEPVYLGSLRRDERAVSAIRRRRRLRAARILARRSAARAARFRRSNRRTGPAILVRRPVSGGEQTGCRSSASAGTKRGPTPAGWASDCRPTPSGPRPARGRSNRRRAASRSAAIRGANRSTSAAHTCTAPAIAEPVAGRRISRRHERRRHPSADRQRVGMDRHAAGRAGRSDAARFRIGDEHSRRRVRHVLREPGHVPLPKRRASALAAAEHRLPPGAADVAIWKLPTTTSRSRRRDEPVAECADDRSRAGNLLISAD